MPTAPRFRCTEPLCPNLAAKAGRCLEHQRPAWEGRPSVKARYGISGSRQQALHRGVLQRAGYVCYRCGLPGADTVDHIVARSDGGSLTDPGNLGAIHQDPCHEEKTREENARRREARRLERERKAGA